jgi:hypothetical protein
MVRLRRALLVAVVGGATAMSVRMSAHQSRLADIVLSTERPIALTTPVTSFKTIQTVNVVLGSAGIRYGVEGPALDEDPSVDLAVPRVQVADLAGMPVGAALNTIAQLDRRVTWREDNGIIDVRLTAGPTWIDRDLSAFAVSNATSAEALDALVTAISPARHGSVKPYGPFADPNVTIFSSRPIPPALSLTLNHVRGTVIDALNSLVRGSHASWRIRYDGPHVDLEDASIEFTTAGRDSVDSESLERANPDVVRVSIASSVVNAFTQFAASAHVSVGVEGLPEPSGPGQPNEQIELALDRRNIRESFERLLALDSRYVLSEEHEMFHVRPKQGTLVPTLDRPIVNFAIDHQPFQTALNQLLGRRPAPGVVVSSWGVESPKDAVFKTNISITADGSTIREALDTLCRSIEASWIVAPEPRGGAWLTIAAPGRSMTTSVQWPSRTDAAPPH